MLLLACLCIFINSERTVCSETPYGSSYRSYFDRNYSCPLLKSKKYWDRLKLVKFHIKWTWLVEVIVGNLQILNIISKLRLTKVSLKIDFSRQTHSCLWISILGSYCGLLQFASHLLFSLTSLFTSGTPFFPSCYHALLFPPIFFRLFYLVFCHWQSSVPLDEISSTFWNIFTFLHILRAIWTLFTMVLL